MRRLVVGGLFASVLVSGVGCGGGAPNLPPSAPVVTISPSSPQTDAELVANVVSGSRDPEGGLVSYGYLWLRDGRPAVEVTGDRVPASRTSRGERWTVVVTPNDGVQDGATGSDAVTIENTPPTSVVSLEPSTPTRTSGLRAVASGEDADGDALTYTYAWTLDGAAQSVRGATVPAESLRRGQRWEVRVVASDGASSSAEATASAEVGNSAPVLSSVTLSPSQPTKATGLRAEAGMSSDPDGDGVTLRYAWMVGGRALANETGAALDPRHYAAGDVVTVSVTPRDGVEEGAPATTSVSIGNTPPTSPVLTSPMRVRDAEDIRCAVSVASVDLDGSPVTYTFSWTRNGQPFGGAQGLDGLTSQVPSSATSERDVFVCAVVASDGTSSVSGVSSAATVVNARPVVTSLALSPSQPTKATPLYVDTPQTSDGDGDGVTLRYAWRVNGVLLPGETTSVLPVARFSRDQLVSVEVVGNDGLEDGPAATASVVVGNSAPTVPQGLIAARARDGEDLVCTVGLESVDADGDAVAYTFGWTRNGQAFSGGVPQGPRSGSVPSSATSAGDVFGCLVSASDGTAVTASAGPVMSVVNARPVVSGVTLTPSPPTRAGPVLAEVGATTDANGDALTLRYAWRVEGALVAGETSASLPGSRFARGQTVTVEVAANDGLEDGPAATATAVVGNSAPTAPGVTITAAPRDADDIVCSVSTPSTDPDGDAVSYTFAWTQNGQPFAGALSGPSSSSVPAHSTSLNDVFGCVVTVSDGVLSILSRAMVASVVGINSSCKDILDSQPGAQDGPYLIDPDGSGPIAAANVYCDMVNGGWTLVGAALGGRRPTVDWSETGGINEQAASANNDTFRMSDAFISALRLKSGLMRYTKSHGVTSYAAPPDTFESRASRNASPLAACEDDQLSLRCGNPPSHDTNVGPWSTYPYQDGWRDPKAATLVGGFAGPACRGKFGVTGHACDFDHWANPSVWLRLWLGPRTSFASCAAVKQMNPAAVNGRYLIDPDAGGPVPPVTLYCDMSQQGWTLVANVYDGIGDDAPNSVDFISSGWQQSGSGVWRQSANAVDTIIDGLTLLAWGHHPTTVSGSHGSAAVSLAFVAALGAAASQRNLKICLVHRDGYDAVCRSSADSTLTLVSYATGNPRLTAYFGDVLAYTYGRLAGLMGSADGYNVANLLNNAYDIPRLVGSQNEFGDYALAGLNEHPAGGPDVEGVWHGRGVGISYRPYRGDDNELGNSNGANPSVNSYGFRLYVGP